MNYFDIFLRIGTAALLGGIIGLQREWVGKEAGFRTHALVSAGSAIIMIVSIYIYEVYKVQGAVVDPSRIAAQVVTGIGFLGAGAIIRSGATIVGLTTAACLWSVAGIGLASGAGFYEISFIGALVILIILVVFQKLENILLKKRKKE